jgi:hypothetical protein
MDWHAIVAIAVAVPVIFFPAAFVWYLNLGGIYSALRESKARKVAGENASKARVF